MNENQNVDIDREQDNGQITYANEVISTIVSVATTEVDGISAIAGKSTILAIAHRLRHRGQQWPAGQGQAAARRARGYERRGRQR